MTDYEKTILWLWLKLTLNRHSLKIFKLFRHFVRIDKVYACQYSDLETLDFLLANEKSDLLDKSLKKAQELFELCEENNIGIITIDNESYPDLLKEIYNPPCVIFYKGDFKNIIKRPCITIVGTRKCTPYGEMQTAEFATKLSVCGMNIVSGIAEGIDTYSISSAIRSDNSAICVLPKGILASTYRKHSLIRDILIKGAVISENLPKDTGHIYSYHARNRILSGISMATLVIEAPKSSGSLMTARYALEQGRDVFALMGNVNVPQAGGTNDLIIQSGAAPVASFLNILEYYPEQFKTILEKQKAYLNEDAQAIHIRTKNKNYDKSKKAAEKILGKEELELFNLFDENEISVDALLERSQLPVPATLQIITRLEAKDVIVPCPGGKYKVLY